MNPTTSGANPPAQPPNPPNGHWAKFWSEWTVLSIIVFVVFYVILMIVTAVFTRDSNIQFWSLWLIVAAGHLWNGFREINEQMRGVLIFFGLMLEDLDSGPHLVLWPQRLRQETKNSIHVAFGTIDQKDKAQMEKAKKTDRFASWYIIEEPVRIKWGDMRSLGLSEAEIAPYINDPDANTMTTDPHLYFRIKISSLRTLIEEVGGLEEAIERIKDTCVQALSEMAGQTFVAKARKELGDLSNRIKERVEDLVGDPQAIARALTNRKIPPRSWGIDVEQVAIRDLGLPHAANTAAGERAATIARTDGEAIGKERIAKATRKEVEERGIGEAVVVERRAEADKIRLTKEGQGRAAAIDAINTASDTPIGRLQLTLDATVRGLADNSKIVVTQREGVSDLLGLVAAGKELITTPDKPKPGKPVAP